MPRSEGARIIEYTGEIIANEASAEADEAITFNYGKECFNEHIKPVGCK
jgi:hypothetical protein